MTFLRNVRFTFSLFVFSLCVFGVLAQEPTGYYSAAEGKNKAELKTALHNIIKSHKALEYYSSSTSFRSTDWHPATSTYPSGYFWDMYSNYKRTSWTGMNREHSMPKSWFGISSGEENSEPIGTDLHNLYPSDANANSAKSNFALGEATSSSVLPNTIIKVGPNTFPGYNGTVFEPANEYKGDFARTYMYMVTCYENYATVWQSTGTSSMLYNNTYPTLKPYAVSLLLKWNANDPVSEKEIVRNNAVYALQQNRNPFIDHPELAEFIWGSRKSEVWTLDVGLPENETFFVVTYDKQTDEISVKINKPQLATYFIQTINGVILQSDKFTSSGTASVAGLQSGMYLLTVYTGTKRKIGKFLVVR